MLRSNISNLINCFFYRIIFSFSMHLIFSQMTFTSKWKLIALLKFKKHSLFILYRSHWDWFRKSIKIENAFMICHISKRTLNASSSQLMFTYSRNKTFSNTSFSMKRWKFWFNQIETLYWWKKISLKHFDICRWLWSINDY